MRDRLFFAGLAVMLVALGWLLAVDPRLVMDAMALITLMAVALPVFLLAALLLLG